MDLATAMDAHRQGRLAEAEAAYRALLQTDPDQLDARHLLGVVCLNSGRVAEALELIGAVTAAAPHFAAAWTNLGHALRQSSRLDEAEQAYGRAMAAGGHDQAREGLEAIRQTRERLRGLQSTLEQEYRAGRWAYLAGLHEAPRHGIIGGYLRHAGTAGPLLDLGCGEGALYSLLPRDLVTDYVGVDIAQAALDNHRAAGQPGCRLFRSPLEEFTPPAGTTFAAILFNEVLLYVNEPLAALRRFRAHLRPGGVMVVSWYCMKDADQKRREDGFWTALNAPEWGLRDLSVLTNPIHDLTWRVGLLQPA